MGGQAEAISGGLRQRHRPEVGLEEALRLAVQALGSVGGEGGAPRTLTADQLEVAVLDRTRRGRAFRRITGAALTALLEAAAETAAAEAPAEAPADQAAAEEPSTGAAADAVPEATTPDAAPESSPTTPEESSADGEA
jgi:proteasome alpha subunit